MKIKAKKTILLTIIMALIFNCVTMASGWQQNIEVEFNNVNLEVNGTPVSANNILYNGTTYVPLRATAEMLGCDVGWDENTNTAKISQFDDNIQLAYIFTNLKTIDSIITDVDNLMDVADFRFTKSHWTYIYEDKSNFDYLTDSYNRISKSYESLNIYKESLYIATEGKTDKSNLDNLYTNLDTMYGKLSYIYSLVNNLVSTSGYICTENEFAYLLLELSSLRFNIYAYYNEIYYDILDYLIQ